MPTESKLVERADLCCLSQVTVDGGILKIRFK